MMRFDRMALGKQAKDLGFVRDTFEKVCRLASKNISREEMLEVRKALSNRIGKYMEAGGYRLSPKSKNHHALDSFVYEYQNAGGVKDNLKIEINYMLRCHVLPVVRKKVSLPWMVDELAVLSVDPIEIFAAKDQGTSDGIVEVPQQRTGYSNGAHYRKSSINHSRGQ